MEYQADNLPHAPLGHALRAEEAASAPQAEVLFSASGWADQGRAFKEVDIPLFGQSPCERYKPLYEYLRRESI